ncbi:formyltetrahydrofolate deformylase [Desertivirga arenae]|uniref:formyltetrahydrofolate deformylase n=1 Tax=Desertivirga arenae TaxID=2810309 RepID=UPI001A956DDB|nr:formyltetrahydrofolate deformylase [Pedobacter sp. SYSU D00823]
MNENLILIECKDKVGLVAIISELMAKHHLNITAMREFVDEDNDTFFARIECFGSVVSEVKLLNELKEVLPEEAKITINPKKEKKVAVLVTKEYHCLGDILIRHSFNTLGANVCMVAGNYDVLKPFTNRFDVPFFYVSHEGRSKQDFEKDLVKSIEEFNPDYIVLAKFMRILSPDFVARFKHKIINIHHSFLPAFIGASPYRQAHERGVKVIGATAHFVTNDLDEGPIIVQQTIPVNHTFKVSDMVTAGKEVEKSVLSKALQLVFQDRVFITGNKTIIFE